MKPINTIDERTLNICWEFDDYMYILRLLNIMSNRLLVPMSLIQSFLRQ